MGVAFIFRGMLIGMFVAIPVGPLGLMSLKRTLTKGWKIGFVSGVGAAASDFIYSFIAILGVSFIGEFLEHNRKLIDGWVGILLLVIGTSILLNAIQDKKRKRECVKEIAEKEFVHPFISNFLMGLSNPITLLVFLAIFARLDMELNLGGLIKNVVFVSSIFTGSSLLWLTITNILKKFDAKKMKYITYIDEVVGIIIILFGISSIIKGIV